MGLDIGMAAKDEEAKEEKEDRAMHDEMQET